MVKFAGFFMSRGHKILRGLKNCCCTETKVVPAAVGRVAEVDIGMEEELSGCAELLLNIAYLFTCENLMKVLLYQHHSALSCFHSSSCESWIVWNGCGQHFTERPPSFCD